MIQITHPGKDLPELLAASIQAVANVLSYDGLAGINAPLESVDSLTSMVRETYIGHPENGGWNLRLWSSTNVQSINFLKSLLSNDSQQDYQKHRAGPGRFKPHFQHPSTSTQQNYHKKSDFAGEQIY